MLNMVWKKKNAHLTHKCVLFAEIGETIGGSAISSSFSAP